MYDRLHRIDRLWLELKFRVDVSSYFEGTFNTVLIIMIELKPGTFHFNPLCYWI